MGQIKILGISLYDYSVKDALRRTWKYLDNGAVNTIAYISTKMLVEAGTKPELKQFIEESDLTIPGETDILKAGGITNKNRYHETENHTYLFELLKRCVKNQKNILLIADTHENLSALEKALRQFNEEIPVTGRIATAEITDDDTLVNEVNDIAPQIIISRLPAVSTQSLMSTNRNRMNAGLWLSLLYDGHLGSSKRSSRLARIKALFYKKIFRRRVNKYNSLDEGKKE